MKLFLVISLLSFGLTAKADVTVIANSGVSLSAGEVIDVFSGDKMSAGGTKLVLADNKSAIGDFASKAMKMDEGKYTAMWAKKSFRDGIPTPKAKNSDAEAIDFVKTTPGGVSYISGAAPADVKTVGKY